MADKKVDEFYTRPPSLSRGQQFSRFLYNSSTGEVLGRTAKSWGEFSRCRGDLYNAHRLKMACGFLFYLTHEHSLY